MRRTAFQYQRQSSATPTAFIIRPTNARPVQPQRLATWRRQPALKKWQQSAPTSASAALAQQHAFSISSAPARRRHERSISSARFSSRSVCDWPYIGSFGDNGRNRHRQHATSTAAPPFSILRFGSYSETLISASSAHAADVIALAS
jgi:hypothetical protein